MTKTPITLLLLAGTAALAAGCSSGPDYAVIGERPADLGMTTLTVQVATDPGDDGLVDLLDDLYVDRVDGDYRILVRCENGLEIGRGFLRNSDDEREMRRVADGC